jgi:hypothetical protein
LALEDDDGPLPRYESALPVVSERGNSGGAVFSPESEVDTNVEVGGEVYADVGTVRAVRSFGGGDLTSCSGCALRS